MLIEVKGKKPYCPLCGKKRKVYLLKEKEIINHEDMSSYYIACNNCHIRFKIENYGMYKWEEF